MGERVRVRRKKIAFSFVRDLNLGTKNRDAIMEYKFCPICKQRHDPDLPCFDLAKQALRDVGIPTKQQRKLTKKFNKLVRKTNVILAIIAVSIISWVVFMAIKTGR